MSEITQFEFNARQGRPAMTPWVVYRFYDRKTATAAHQEMSKKPGIECGDILISTLKDPFVRVFLSSSRFLQVDTTGLVNAGSLVKHYSTGTRTETWFCYENEVSRVKSILEDSQAAENSRANM